MFLLPGLRTLQSDYFVHLNVIVESLAQEQEFHIISSQYYRYMGLIKSVIASAVHMFCRAFWIQRNTEWFAVSI